MFKHLLIIFLFVVPATCAQTSQTSSKTGSLPKIVLVGDSIRMSYAPAVTRRLAGKAEVVSSKSNGGDSSNVLKHLQAWVIAEQPAIVHFNCGIHDTKKFTGTGKFQVSPEQYEANLRQIVADLRDKTDAVLIFATSTPILDDRAKAARQQRDYELLGASIEQYNTIARKVMAELNVPINDLHKVLTNSAAPATVATLIAGDGVHLTAPAQELLGEKVADVVLEKLTTTPESSGPDANQ